MIKELKKRITTSILLFLLTIFCIFVHKYFFIIAILITSYFAFDEISTIIVRVRNLNEVAKKNNKTDVIILFFNSLVIKFFQNFFLFCYTFL